MEQPTVVSADKWSLHRGAVVSLRWSMGQPTVVTTDRWSFYILYIWDPWEMEIYRCTHQNKFQQTSSKCRIHTDSGNS